MTENQKKWLLYLQEKGVMFEYSNGAWVKDKEWAFTAAQKYYRIPAQSVPDIPDWRELCWEMQEKGVMFESICRDGSWESRRSYFFPDYMHKTDYRIPNQSIPEWREEMTEETKPDQREEIPHRELRIQWHEDMLHHLRNGELMPVWEYRLKNGDGEWKICHDPHFSEKYEYRRKPRMKKVPMWYCMTESLSCPGGYMVFDSRISRENLQYQVDAACMRIIGPITQVEINIPDAD